MCAEHNIVPDDVVDTPLLDALSESLYQHSQAHRERLSMGQADQISLHRLRPVISQLINTKPSLFRYTVVKFLERLEKIPRPFLNLGFKTVAAYHFFGIIGIVAACIFPLLLVTALDLSLFVILSLLIASAFLTWIYIKVTILITKKDAVVFLNYFLTLLTGSFFVLRTLNQPVLVYMDIIILGGGLLFAFGRIGCFMAGCCYGKPSLYGVRYDKHHKKNGFPRLLLRVRLLPVQLLESGWLFVLTTFCTVLLFITKNPGITLSTFVILLALGRFILEIFRGDPNRPYRQGLSQAQWTSVFLITVTATLQAIGFLPYQQWQSFILASFLILLIPIVLRSKNVSLHSVYSAGHIHEIAELFALFKKGNLIPASTRRSIHIKKTSQDILLSENRIPIQGRTALHHITLSSIGQRLSYWQAANLSKYMVSWYKQAGIHVLLSDSDNIYHLIHFTIDAS